MANSKLERLVAVSYNLHGYNQGSLGIKELIATVQPEVIMVQEHWLTADNLLKLNYFVFGSSALNYCIIV